MPSTTTSAPELDHIGMDNDSLEAPGPTGAATESSSGVEDGEQRLERRSFATRQNGKSRWEGHPGILRRSKRKVRAEVSWRSSAVFEVTDFFTSLTPS